MPHRQSVGTAARGPSALHSLWRQSQHRTGRIDARGSRKRLARRQLVARWRQQGYMGSGIVISIRVRESATMLSRVADSFYWMSRYLERAENTVRQLDVTITLMIDTGGASAESRWQRLMASLGKPAGMEWDGDLDSMARKLVFDSINPASVTSCLNGARENARQVREEISSEQWQRLNRLFHQIHSPHTQAQFNSSRPE